MTDGIRITHVGLCVSDIVRSTEFYCTALGFSDVGRMQVNDAASEQLLDVPGLALELVYLQRDGFRLELLGYDKPGTVGDSSPRPMNALGFTHLSFRVDDPEVVLQAIEAHGGIPLNERTVTFTGGNRGVMATDPDGNLIELIERIRQPNAD
jgi:catechol 2,3-dioxygenase-like lactoylglutathione lyase family enzyme